MAAPLTQMEIDETPTSLATEDAFFAQIVAETDLTRTVAGYTVNGAPIHRVDIGNPAGAGIMIVGLQHGTELAGREGALMFIRDIAYSTDPDVLAYLAEHRITVIPTVNVDNYNVLYENVNGMNINREYFRLTQPEAVAVWETFMEVAPAIIIDAHVTVLEDAAWQPVPSRMPGTHPAITAASVDLMDAVSAPILADGWTVKEYRWTAYAWSALGSVAGGMHSLGMLIETSARVGANRMTRSTLSRDSFHTTVEWHHANAATVEAARSASMQAALTSKGATAVPDREVIGATTTSIEPYATANVSGYHLTEPIPAHLLDLHGITATDTYVSVQQPARLIIAGLCDPQSLQKVVTAVRDSWPDPLPDVPVPDGVPASAQAMVAGIPRPIIGTYHRINGENRPAHL